MNTCMHAHRPDLRRGHSRAHASDVAAHVRGYLGTPVLSNSAMLTLHRPSILMMDHMFGSRRLGVGAGHCIVCSHHHHRVGVGVADGGAHPGPRLDGSDDDADEFQSTNTLCHLP